MEYKNTSKHNFFATTNHQELLQQTIRSITARFLKQLIIKYNKESKYELIIPNDFYDSICIHEKSLKKMTQKNGINSIRYNHLLNQLDVCNLFNEIYTSFKNFNRAYFKLKEILHSFNKFSFFKEPLLNKIADFNKELSPKFRIRKDFVYVKRLRN